MQKDRRRFAVDFGKLIWIRKCGIYQLPEFLFLLPLEIGKDHE